MGRLSSRMVALALGAFATSTQAQNNIPQPRNVPFNTSGSHGPGGPWNYITLNMGSEPESYVDMYPMLGSPVSVVITQDVCSNGAGKQCMSPVPGYYDAKSGSARDAGSNAAKVDLMDVEAMANMNASGFLSVANVNQPFQVDNLTIFQSSNARSSYNKLLYTPIGLLSLEPTSGNETHFSNGQTIPGQHTILEAYTEETGGSDTIGMHLGSAIYNQTGSLYLGGYDQYRLIEQPAVFTNTSSVNISSISFGRAAGLSPWINSDTPIANFLQSPISANFSPQVPNMLLPFDLCNLFQRYLPIAYDQTTNLYLWNTTAPLYSALMSSPAYINFTFSNTAQTSIKIPFALLSLNLTSPIENPPLQYFPCQPVPGPIFTLGRAFLQGIIYIQSFKTPQIIIGQAPGPSVNGSTPAYPRPLIASNVNATPNPVLPLWNDTWAAYLTPLSLPPGEHPTSGLGSGAIAGIVIGSIVATGLIVGGAVFLVIRRRASRFSPVSLHEGPMRIPAYNQIDSVPSTPAPLYTSNRSSAVSPSMASASGHHAQEIDGREGFKVHEADGAAELVEVPAAHGPSQGFIAEMEDTSVRAEIGDADTQK